MTATQVYVDAFMQSLAGEEVELNPQLQPIFARILGRQVTVDDDTHQVETTPVFDTLASIFTYVAVTERPAGGPFGYTASLDEAETSAQQAVDDFISGGEDRQDIELFALDGTLTAAASFDAGDGAFNLIDNVATESNTEITNFGADDQLTFDGVTANEIDVSSSNGHTLFQFDNGTGTVSQITLVGVEGFFTNVEEFNANSVGNIVFG